MSETNSASGQRSSLHGFWSSKMAFILAVTGSAVGLGNIWKFPYIAGENGGGAFVLIYLVCVFAIGLPIMMSETMLGRRGRRNPVASMTLLGEEEGGSGSWGFVGLSGVVAAFLILSYYSVIAGWVLAYVFKSAAGTFVDSNAVFVRETIGELRKVSWPTRKEATNLTIVVLIVIFVMSTFLGVLDAIYSQFFALLFGT